MHILSKEYSEFDLSNLIIGITFLKTVEVCDDIVISYKVSYYWYTILLSPLPAPAQVSEISVCKMRFLITFADDVALVNE